MVWPLLVVASLAATLLTLLLAPLLVLFARVRPGPVDNSNASGVEPRLPNWLRWFGTDDNSLLGDNGHKARWVGKPRYMQMVAWLWRNPNYVFETDILGATILPAAPITQYGDPWIKNRDRAKAGWYFCTVGGYWNLKCIKQITTDRCVMIEFGWKLQPYAQYGAPVTPYCAQVVCSVRLTAFNQDSP